MLGVHICMIKTFTYIGCRHLPSSTIYQWRSFIYNSLSSPPTVMGSNTKKQHNLQPNVLFQNQTFLHRRCHRDQTTTKWGKCIISFSSQIPIKLFSVFDWNIIILNLNAYHLDVDYEMSDCKKKMWSVKPLKANYAIRIVFCCCLQ